MNAALESVRYSPAADWNGNTSVWLRANDMGHTGVGGAMETVARFKVEVTAVNDAPSVHWRGAPLEAGDATAVSSECLVAAVAVAWAQAGCQPNGSM